jgi:hypothetical protein
VIEKKKKKNIQNSNTSALRTKAGTHTFQKNKQTSVLELADEEHLARAMIRTVFIAEIQGPSRKPSIPIPSPERGV